MLRDGLAVVRGSHRALHLAREQPEAGVGVLGSRGTAQIPGHPGATLHRPHDLHSDGLLCLHDLCAEGQEINTKMYSVSNGSRVSWVIFVFILGVYLSVSSLFPCLCCMESFCTWELPRSEASR